MLEVKVWVKNRFNKQLCDKRQVVTDEPCHIGDEPTTRVLIDRRYLPAYINYQLKFTGVNSGNSRFIILYHSPSIFLFLPY
jgi:hypothetical protein